MTYPDMLPMLRWRLRSIPVFSFRPITPELFVDSLSNESLRYTKIPPAHDRAVIGFHERTQAGRLLVAKRFLAPHNARLREVRA